MPNVSHDTLHGLVVGKALAQDTGREAMDDLAGLIENGLGSEHIPGTSGGT
ncbi:hypothetical protein [Streptomyces hirsutus]|uniref:Uncharacterized protein n=1 Tax=Streptomyces hirsutus TaxID=35620 RepID=A0ABZ1GUU0_9ACTN|nr:hypothetical protein [Streptomyces hirsutus]WSD09665.1 hypothetical protein OIE73_30620 [Streptomyces hirsutus]